MKLSESEISMMDLSFEQVKMSPIKFTLLHQEERYVSHLLLHLSNLLFPKNYRKVTEIGIAYMVISNSNELFSALNDLI